MGRSFVLQSLGAWRSADSQSAKVEIGNRWKWITVTLLQNSSVTGDRILINVVLCLNETQHHKRLQTGIWIMDCHDFKKYYLFIGYKTSRIRRVPSGKLRMNNGPSREECWIFCCERWEMLWSVLICRSHETYTVYIEFWFLTAQHSLLNNRRRTC